MAEERENRKLVAVVFTDLEGYTAMVQQDERKALQYIDAHRDALFQLVPQYHGKIVQFYGDGSLSYHESVLDAVQCALALQKIYLEADPVVPVRIGIHLGDIIFRGDSIFGDGVNVASRIQALGKAGCILVSQKVADEIKNHPQLPLQYLYNAELKNVKEPVPVYALNFPFLVVPEAPSDQAKHLLAEPRRNRMFWVVIVAFLVLVTGLITIFNKKIFSNHPTVAFNPSMVDTIHKIAVLPFSNLTMSDDLAEVSKMAAHWISHGLALDPKVKVLSYDAVDLLSKEGLGDAQKREQFAISTGAVTLVEGDYFKEGNQLIFKTSIRDAKTGDYLFHFPQVEIPVSDALAGIEAVENQVKGYLASQNDNLLTPPNYEAYKAYITAKELWDDDDEAAYEELNKAIQLDSTFLDAYFLRLDYYYNTRQYAEAAQALTDLEMRFPPSELTDRERNRFYYHNADVNGNNRKAFEYYMSEYQVDPTDIFINTDASVLALEYVNDPEKCVEILNQIPYDHLNFDQCEYCLIRLEMGIRSYLQLGQIDHARQVASYIPARHDKLFLSQVQSRYLAHLSDTTALDALMENTWAQVYDSTSLDYLMAWVPSEFALLGNHRLEKKYASRALKRLENKGPSLELAKTLQHLDRYQEAWKVYNNLAQTNRDNRYELARSAVLDVKLGRKNAALDIISQLENNRKAFDYGFVPYYQALIYTQLGDREQTANKMQQAIQEGRKYYLERFQNEPDFAPYYQTGDTQ
ncbi:MAG: adenylate/guanylate cyclase domain-containing protein [Saprospiraceae bacterium]|nr:adenylate/guanylate cyclase domain-containing protein [Saprospiraceae bacterium]